jgi:hypothetical protein
MVTEGTSIGVVIHDLRQQGAWPTNREVFLARYDRAFRYNVNFCTNLDGDLEGRRNSVLIWKVSNADGAVRRVGASHSEETGIVALLREVDFSKRLDGLNVPSVEPSFLPEVQNKSEQIWKYYFR